jgi:excisionase family DNA binding protein
MKEAADRLNISTDTLRRIIRRGELATVRVGLRGVRIEEAELERYIRERKA